MKHTGPKVGNSLTSLKNRSRPAARRMVRDEVKEFGRDQNM